MCGIVGYIGHRDAWPVVLKGLQQLEYRGYDSAGIAVLNPEGQLETYKSVGKVKELAAMGSSTFPLGKLGLGHTRWATHGRPSMENAHPHSGCRLQLSVVHNGIVENYKELKQELMVCGHTFSSETDSEVLAHLIESGMESGLSFEDAFIAMSTKLQGSQAVVATGPAETPNKLLALRVGHAGGIVIGQQDGEAIVSSDLPAVVPFAREVAFLDDGEIAIVTSDGVRYVDTQGNAVDKHTQPVYASSTWADKEGFKHYMLKEIMEQPRVVARALRERVSFERSLVNLEDFPLSLDEIRDLRRVVLIGMGTSLHAAMVGRYFMESLAGIPAEVDNASEFRYRDFHLDGKTLAIAVGQSGETADTLAAMSAVLEKGGRLLTVCNAGGSQATRLAEGTLFMRSGLEVGVASTKTFIASLATLFLTALYLGQARDSIDPARRQALLNELAHMPHLLGELLADTGRYEDLARQLYKFQNFLYLGRGLNFPIALEGALKLKEVAYVHSEGYPAGEMKHGPIALIDPSMPVVAIAPQGSMYSKMANNIKEVKARDGMVVAILSEGDKDLASEVDHVLPIPHCSEELTPFLTVPPLQMLAYYMAVRRGCDVDQPRNLAKSVTVE